MLTVQLVVGQVVTSRTAGMKLIATKKDHLEFHRIA